MNELTKRKIQVENLTEYLKNYNFDLKHYDIVDVIHKLGKYKKYKAIIMLSNKENDEYKWSVQYCGNGHYFRTREELDEYCRVRGWYKNRDRKSTYMKLGLELEYIRCYVLKVLCDTNNQSTFTKREFGVKLSKIDDIISGMKNELEIKMYNNGCEWADTNIFYGNSRIVNPIITETRESISKVSERKVSDNPSLLKGVEAKWLADTHQQR